MADPVLVPPAATETMTGSIERDSITPEQFMAEMAAQGLAGPEGDTPADGAKPDAEAKPADGAEKPAADAKLEGDKPAEVEAKADDKPASVEDKPAEAKPDDSAEVKAARKIYNAAARKEAAALRTQQENKQLKGTIEQLTKLRDEDPASLLSALGFGNGTEKDPLKDLLGRIVSKGEKPAPTLEEKVAALEAQLASEKTEASKRTEAATIAAAKARITDTIKAAGEKFDLVNAFGAHERVTDVMEAYFETHGVPIDPLLAAEHVERDLAAGLAKSTKFKAPAGAPAQAAKPATTSTGNKPASTAMGKSETLTNTDSGRTEPEDELPMEDHDARAKAVAKALGMGFARN